MTDLPQRQRCYRCLRPTKLCYCPELPTVDTTTRIVILQHPHERTHPFGTARLANLCMPNTSLHVPWSGLTGTLTTRLDVPPDVAVLYPRANAIELDSLPHDRWPSTLIVIDGTWAHAKRLHRENAWLHDKLHIRLQPAAPSRYRIRKEPRPDYISTIEAIVGALRILEPETPGLDQLLRAFDQMIDLQLAQVKRTPKALRRRQSPQHTSRAISASLADPALVIVHAEVCLPGGDRCAQHELVHWVAARIGDGETFEAFLRPAASLPTAQHLRHVGLDARLLRDGETVDAAAVRFARFLGSGTPIAAWTQSILSWGRQLLPAGGAQTLLKTCYCNTSQSHAGHLETILAREGLLPFQNTCQGRGGRRLASTMAIARWLRDRLHEPPPHATEFGSAIASNPGSRESSSGPCA